MHVQWGSLCVVGLGCVWSLDATEVAHNLFLYSNVASGFVFTSHVFVMMNLCMYAYVCLCGFVFGVGWFGWSLGVHASCWFVFGIPFYLLGFGFPRHVSLM